MKRRAATLPDGWDYGPERRPPRTSLVSVDPAGLGTADVGALSSYLPRLAAAHDLPAGLFARDVLAPALGRGDVAGATRDDWGRYFAGIFAPVRGSLDGVGRLAATWVAALETLTGRHDLAGLTLLRWSVVLPPARLTRAERRVCPPCLDARLAGPGPVYESLLWRMAPLEACFAHEVPIRLESRCPSCGRTSGILGTWSQPGRCGACGEWLGRPAEATARLDSSDADLAWQQFVWTELRELLVVGQSPEVGEPSPTGVTRMITLAVERPGATLTAFASRVGYSLSLVSLWRAGRRLPTLDAALRICWASGFRLTDLFTGREDAAAERPETADRANPPAAPRFRRIAWRRLERTLEAALLADPPPTFAAVVERFSADRSQVRKRLPALSAAVRDRHAAWRAETIAARRAREVDLIVEGTRRLRREGLYPGRDRVQRALPEGIWMRDPHLRAAWKAELRRLGLL